jgi:TfoX/Sxy family transcriptional regulator of competence genes
MVYDGATADRIRRLLGGRDDVEEKRMVGGLSFLVGGHMCCGVSGGELMVRLPPDAVAAAVEEPHVRPMTLGGKTVKAFVLVAPPGYADEAELAAWLARGIEAVSRLP